MKHLLTVFALVAIAGAISAVGQVAAPVKTHLKVGDMAPDFKLPGSTVKGTFAPSDFKGKNTVVLAFFPAAFTGGCTKEMKGYGADIEKFEAMGAKVFGISTDNAPSQAYWATNVLDVKVAMLSDFHKQISKLYGVLNETSGTANRTTFVIDKDGKITYIEEGNTATDVSGAAAACSRLSH